MPSQTHEAIIREMNDRLRIEGIGGRIMITAGVNALPESDKKAILNAIREFASFTKDNDPYGEHDCAAINVAEHDILWKIDYYNLDMSGGSSDAANADITTRVLTIMLSNEY